MLLFAPSTPRAAWVRGLASLAAPRGLVFMTDNDVAVKVNQRVIFDPTKWYQLKALRIGHRVSIASSVINGATDEGKINSL